MRNLLEIDSVILEFGLERILQNVYLKSETGKITGLLGRNGSGKSSLMKIIFGDINPNRKSIRLNEKVLLSNYRSHKDIRYLPQHHFIPQSLTVERVLQDFELDIKDLIAEFPLFKQYAKTKLKRLSSGERRILEIYIVLIANTKFCMLDEPFSQVMPIHVEALKKLIVREKEKKGIIITDHLYQHVVGICDDLYVISKGQTYLTNTIHDLEMFGYLNSKD